MFLATYGSLGSAGPGVKVHGEVRETPVLTQEEARELLDSIDTSTVVRLRDRALIATIIYTFGRVGAVIKMRVEDYYTQGRRGDDQNMQV